MGVQRHWGDKLEEYSNTYLLVCKGYQACPLSDLSCWDVSFGTSLANI